jgi:hypothetical protein
MVAYAFAFPFRGQGARAETADFFNENGKLGGWAVVPGDALSSGKTPPHVVLRLMCDG